MPVSRIATRSARFACQRREVREHARVEHRQQLRELRAARRTSRTACRRPACSAFHLSFWAIGTMTSLNSGLPSRETWTHGPDSARSSLAGSSSRVLRRLAAPQTPITAFGAIGSVGTEPSRVSWLDRHLDRDRVHVERRRRVDAHRAGRSAIRCRFWNGRRSPRSKIDAQVDVEPLGPLAGEHLHAAARACAPPASPSAGCSSASSAARCCTAGRRRFVAEHLRLGAAVVVDSSVSPVTS